MSLLNLNEGVGLLSFGHCRTNGVLSVGTNISNVLGRSGRMKCPARFQIIQSNGLLSWWIMIVGVSFYRWIKFALKLKWWFVINKKKIFFTENVFNIYFALENINCAIFFKKVKPISNFSEFISEKFVELEIFYKITIYPFQSSNVVCALAEIERHILLFICNIFILNLYQYSSFSSIDSITISFVSLSLISHSEAWKKRKKEEITCTRVSWYIFHTHCIIKSIYTTINGC